MHIKSVQWIDKATKEADVVVSDGENDILCFSHPFTGNIGDQLLEPIISFDATDIMTSDETEILINRDGSSYRYFVRGKLSNKNKKIVNLGGLVISIKDSHLPKDIIENSFIEFFISRFNIF